ncbi:MAG: hypothetical protein H6R25_3053 [Proteobacteria bacterium]|nr:hypothetical protein [Pseudomonadota bacterium]
MNSVKSFLVKMTSHALEGTITFLSVLFAMGSLYWFESGWLKFVGMAGSLIVGYVITYWVARMRD